MSRRCSGGVEQLIARLRPVLTPANLNATWVQDVRSQKATEGPNRLQGTPRRLHHVSKASKYEAKVLSSRASLPHAVSRGRGRQAAPQVPASSLPQSNAAAARVCACARPQTPKRTLYLAAVLSVPPCVAFSTVTAKQEDLITPQGTYCSSRPCGQAGRTRAASRPHPLPSATGLAIGHWPLETGRVSVERQRMSVRRAAIACNVWHRSES